MDELKLTHSDKVTLKADIKLTLLIGSGLFILLAGIITITAILFWLFSTKNFSEGSTGRALYIFCLLSLPFLFLSIPIVRKYIDLKADQKIRFTTNDYGIQKIKDDILLIIRLPFKLKIELDEDLFHLLLPGSPITIEVTKWSKTILFISHDTNNLWKNMEQDHKD